MHTTARKAGHPLHLPRAHSMSFLWGAAVGGSQNHEGAVQKLDYPAVGLRSARGPKRVLNLRLIARDSARPEKRHGQGHTTPSCSAQGHTRKPQQSTPRTVPWTSRLRPVDKVTNHSQVRPPVGVTTIILSASIPRGQQGRTSGASQPVLPPQVRTSVHGNGYLVSDNSAEEAAVSHSGARPEERIHRVLVVARDE